MRHWHSYDSAGKVRIPPTFIGLSSLPAKKPSSALPRIFVGGKPPILLMYRGTIWISTGMSSFCHINSRSCSAVNEIKKCGDFRLLNVSRPHLHNGPHHIQEGLALSENIFILLLDHPTRGGSCRRPRRGSLLCVFLMGWHLAKW